MIRRLLEWLRRRKRVEIPVDELTGMAGEIEIRVYDVDDARERWPDWDELPKSRRAELVRQLDPDSVDRTTNAILDEWLEHLVDLMDQTQTDTAEEVTHFAVGTDDTEPQSTDTGLVSEVYRTEIDTETDNGKDFDASGFLDSTEANGNTLKEAALATASTAGNGLEVNRGLISSTEKTSQKLITTNFTIKYRNA